MEKPIFVCNSIKEFNVKDTSNRYTLSKIIDCIKFCGAFEVLLRGHDGTDESTNPGIFRGLIGFVSELDVIVKEHLGKSTAFKGTSKTIKNELLDFMLNVIQAKIKEEIRQADFISIEADETTDSSNKTQIFFIVYTF